MTKLVWTFLALVVGVLAGLGLTASAVDQPPNFGVIELGPWIVRPRIGSIDADPYSRALLATRGESPVAASEGIGLAATTDSNRGALLARCAYKIAGQFPAARYWTLTAYRRDGALIGGADRRSAYSSTEVIRDHTGAVEIALSAEPQPGNWVPLPADGSFELILRLYDTQVSGNARGLDAASVPKIARGACR